MVIRQPVFSVATEHAMARGAIVVPTRGNVLAPSAIQSCLFATHFFARDRADAWSRAGTGPIRAEE
jgi:hypothetical protein